MYKRKKSFFTPQNQTVRQTCCCTGDFGLGLKAETSQVSTEMKLVTAYQYQGQAERIRPEGKKSAGV